ncbi:hypothetical protein LINPERHAP2_LOCUS2910 [Linum perenne]
MEELLAKAREFYELRGGMKEGYYSTDGLGRKVSVASAPKNQQRPLRWHLGSDDCESKPVTGFPWAVVQDLSSPNATLGVFD